jgi:kumamolisin
MNKPSKLLGLLIGALGVAATGAAAPIGSSMVNLNGTLRPEISKIRPLGHHDPQSKMQVTVALKLRNTDELDRFLAEVNDPASPRYHHFLTPAEFKAEYGPTANQVNAVVQYLGSRGLHVQDVSRDNLLIHVKGDSGSIERGFGIRINDYSFQGRKVFAASAEAQMRPDVARYVESVIGLDDLARFKPHLARAHACDGGPNVCVSSDPSHAISHGPVEIATAYDWPSITDTSNGSGVTIAIGTAESSGIGSSPDFNVFWDFYGLPHHSISAIAVDGNSGLTDGTIESTLDVEYSGAMAPGANIVLYVADVATLPDLIDVYEAVADDNTAQIFSTSWGLMESSWTTGQLRSADNIFRQMAAQGISAFAAAGDDGSSDDRGNPSGPAIADFPSSNPYVLAAGGTNLQLNTDGTIADESAWNELSAGFGATGGADSAFYPKPPWQTGTGVPGSNHRKTSDLSMDADPETGYVVYEAGSWQLGNGGTSFVAPELAGLFAVKVSQTGSRFGQAAPAVYAAANGANYASDFNDVTSGDNGAHSAGTGWDYPTGWGSPNATNLLADLAVQATDVPKAFGTSITADTATAIGGKVYAYASGQGFGSLSYHVSTGPAHGSISMNSTSGSFTYTPDAGYAGSDSLTYTATDGAGTSAAATISATVLSDLSAPQSFKLTFTGCTNHVDYYDASWLAGDTGTPNSYTIQMSANSGPWTTVYTGGVKFTQVSISPNTLFQVRIRESSGSLNSPWNTKAAFTSSGCTPPP